MRDPISPCRGAGLRGGVLFILKLLLFAKLGSRDNKQDVLKITTVPNFFQMLSSNTRWPVKPSSPRRSAEALNMSSV